MRAALPSRADDPGERAAAAGAHAARRRDGASARRGGEGTASGAVTEAVRPCAAFVGTTGGPPVTHLLSNGRYAVMLTATGAGYSRWRDIAVTRWREDATRDDWGSFVFLRDMPERQGLVGRRTAGGQRRRSRRSRLRRGPCGVHPPRRIADDHHGRAGLGRGRRRSPPRRFANSGRRTREIETDVLCGGRADDARRRQRPSGLLEAVRPDRASPRVRRADRDAPSAVARRAAVWAAHFAVVEGEVAADPQYETDRARFIGRGPHAWPTPLRSSDGQPLSNTVGTVLDPIFSLRQRVMVPPGKVARVAFWTVVASSRDELLRL